MNRAQGRQERANEKKERSKKRKDARKREKLRKKPWQQNERMEGKEEKKPAP